MILLSTAATALLPGWAPWVAFGLTAAVAGLSVLLALRALRRGPAGEGERSDTSSEGL